MTPPQIVKVMTQGEEAGRGDLYGLSDCPYPHESRKAKLWAAGFLAGRGERADRLGLLDQGVK